MESASSPTKLQLQSALNQEKRKLEAEREESLSRLMQIEKRLVKTKQTSKLWDSDESEGESGSDSHVIKKKGGKA